MLKKTLGSERVNKTRRLEYTSNCNDDSEGKLEWNRTRVKQNERRKRRVINIVMLEAEDPKQTQRLDFHENKWNTKALK